MRYPKFTAALAALALTAGGLALAGPALAEDGTSDAPTTQEVASSPDTSSTVPSTESPSATAPDTSETPSTGDTTTPPAPPTEPTTSSAAPEESTTTPSTDSNAKPESSTATDPASETDTTTSTSVEGWWAMPNGGTGDNVTWPQAVASANSLQCGVWYQVDLYPSADVLAGLQADGRLDQGEDYSTVISWRFVYGGDCPLAPGPANPAANIEQVCGLATVTVTNVGENILTASVVVYLDGNYLTALAVPAGESSVTPIGFGEDTGEHVVSVRTGPAFGDVELARAENIESDCIAAPPVVTPPTETPTPTPTPSVTPAPAPSATPAAAVPVEEVASTERLASTGSDVEWIIWGGIIIIGLGIIGFAFGRKPHTKK